MQRQWNLISCSPHQHGHFAAMVTLDKSMWWCPQLHVDRPGYSNLCRRQLCQTPGVIYLTVTIEDSIKSKIISPSKKERTDWEIKKALIIRTGGRTVIQSVEISPRIIQNKIPHSAPSNGYRRDSGATMWARGARHIGLFNVLWMAGVQNCFCQTCDIYRCNYVVLTC